MRFGEALGFKVGRWLSNEQLIADDLNFLDQKEYQNLADMAAIIVASTSPGVDIDDSNQANTVLSGLILEHNNLLVSDLRAGMAGSLKEIIFN